MSIPAINNYSATASPPIEALVAAADIEGHGFVRRTAEEWTSGANRFDAPDEMWLLAELGGAVVGMCGVNRDPYLDDPWTGRLRHLYVHPDHRSGGLGARLVEACVSHAWRRFNSIRLRTPGGAADRFYEALDFERVSSDTATHQRRPKLLNPAFEITRIELIRHLAKHEFGPDRPPSVGGVGLIGLSLLFIAADAADNWVLPDTVDGGGVDYWESSGNRLETFSRQSLGFEGIGDILSKASFEDRETEIAASVSVGNVNPQSGEAALYKNPVMVRSADGVMLKSKRLEPIDWTLVLQATIDLDGTISVG